MKNCKHNVAHSYPVTGRVVCDCGMTYEEVAKHECPNGMRMDQHKKYKKGPEHVSGKPCFCQSKPLSKEEKTAYAVLDKLCMSGPHPKAVNTHDALIEAIKSSLEGWNQLLSMAHVGTVRLDNRMMRSIRNEIKQLENVIATATGKDA